MIPGIENIAARDPNGYCHNPPQSPADEKRYDMELSA